MKKKLLLLFVPAVLGLYLASCGGGDSSNTPTDGGNTPVVPVGPETPEKKDITGITFESQKYTFDGNPHTLEIKGTLPTGGSVKYTNAGPHTNAGTYNATALITAPDYKDLTLNATLTIEKAEFSGYKYESLAVKYDGNDHINDI